MTAYDLHTTAAARQGWLASTLARLSAARARRALFSQTVRELGALSDRELADLGIHRSQITAIAGECAARATR